MSKERNYSKEEKENALSYYHKCRSNAKTRRILGYPSKSCLNNWITSEGKDTKPRVVRGNCKGNASFDEKMEAIYRCYELNEDIKLVAKELNRAVTTIRTWHRPDISQEHSYKQNSLFNISTNSAALSLSN